MANTIQYSTSPQHQALKKGNFWIGTGDVPHTATSTSGYWSSISPPVGGYTIYLNKASQGPSIYCPKTDAELVKMTNQIAGTAYTTVAQCFTYFSTQSDKMVFSKEVEPVATNGLVLYLDPNNKSSYPGSGTSYYDLSGSGANATLQNGAAISTGRYTSQAQLTRVNAAGGYSEQGLATDSAGFNDSMVFDGANDYLSIPNSLSLMPPTELTVEMVIKANSITSGWVRLFGKDSYTNSWLIFLETGGTKIRALHQVNGIEYRCNTSRNISTTEYTHVVFTFKTGDAIRSYFNGETGDGVVSLPAGTFSYNGTGDFLLGHQGASYFNGDIALVRVYDRVLTTDEIKNNYRQSLSSHMNLLNSASILLNADERLVAYAEDTVYSQLPTNGTGDFTFSGGDGGTRVNQQGYIEVTPVNLLRHSETYASWSLEGGTISGGWPDPIGGNTAYKYTSVGTNGLWSNGAFGPTYSGHPLPATITISFWIKSFSGAAMQAYLSDGVATSHGWVSIIGEWQQITVTFNPNGPWGGFYLSTLSDPTKSFYIWHPQINIGSTAKPYQPTTDRLNYPRITYQNGRGALLSEPQRTNLNTNSQFISSSTYSTSGLTIVYGSTTSPDGTQNASKLVEDTGSGQRYILKNSPFGSFGTYVCSFYAKPNGREWIYFEVGAVYGYANIANGELGSTGTFDAGWAFNNYGIEPWKDGWYRVWITGTWSSGGAYYAPKIHPAISNGNFSYTGNGVSGIYVYGIQVEAGLYPTSYIPTTSATVTRPADVAAKTSATSLIGQSSGTVYFDFTLDNLYSNAQTNQPVLWYMKDGGPGERYVELINGNLLYYIEYDGSVIASISSPAIDVGKHKCAIAYANNDMVFYVDGVQVGIDGSGIPSGFSTFSTQYYASFYYGQFNAHTLAAFTSRLTNTQLEELTTLRSASGGSVSYDGPYAIHTFTGDGTFTPDFSGTIEVLVVAGGGGGGSHVGGGGGGGGLISRTAYSVIAETPFSVIIGAGGAGGPADVRGSNGSNTYFGSATAIGGGGGGTWGGAGDPNGRAGGSGGGASGTQGVQYASGGTSITSQGNAGGNVGPRSGYNATGAGGGGASGAAASRADSSDPTKLNGADGLPFSILGTTYYFAGGGGPGAFNAVEGGDGGKGGGAGGASTGSTGGTGDTKSINSASNGATGSASTGGSGATNSGGGGGGGAGGSAGIGGPGGSGIVIVRYLV